jgi:hypothetical protein
MTFRRITLCGLQNGYLIIWIVSSKFGKRGRPDSETSSNSGSTTPSKSQHEGLEALVTSNSASSIPEKLIDALEQQLEGKAPSDGGRVTDDGASEATSAELSECMFESLDSIDETFERLEHYYDGLITSIRSYTDGFNVNLIVASALSPTYVYT